MSLIAANNTRLNYKKAAEDLRDNPGQWKAYQSKGNCVILAGPGSGKTKTLTIKMARMLAEDVRSPGGIACITYSTECARELQRRLAHLGVEEGSNVFIGTVHSFCLKNVILPFGKLSDLKLPNDFAVASVGDQDLIFSGALKQVVGGDENPSRFRTGFDRYRRTYLDHEAKAFAETDVQTAALIVEYEKRLIAAKLVDFDGMVLWGLRLLERHAWLRKSLRARFPILVVDEYQDLGLPLHRIVLSLCEKAGVRLLAVGDQDQSIYGFTGAMPELLGNLSQSGWVEPPVRLKFNYRCGRQIVAASLTALGEDRGYESKVSQGGTIDFCECPKGIDEQAATICQQIVPSALKRLSGLTLGKIAVLYADRNDGEIIASAAEDAGFKFVRIDSGSAYRRTPLTRWLEDCAAWCAGGWQQQNPRLSTLVKTWLGFNRTARGTEQRTSARRSLVEFLFSNRHAKLTLATWLSEIYALCLAPALKSEPTLRDEHEAFKLLVEACGEKGRLAKFDIATFSGQSGSPDHLNLITLHSAKGLEFDVVIMMGMDQGKVPSWSARSPEAMREARRLFYVGLTRAKHEVHMTYSGFTVDKYGRPHVNGPSVFLIELQKKLAESDAADSVPF
jgi:DNA helicase-2/ATP-dependent DNA helicase PcrA